MTQMYSIVRIDYYQVVVTLKLGTHVHYAVNFLNHISKKSINELQEKFKKEKSIINKNNTLYILCFLKHDKFKPSIISIKRTNRRPLGYS